MDIEHKDEGCPVCGEFVCICPIEFRNGNKETKNVERN